MCHTKGETNGILGKWIPLCYRKIPFANRWIFPRILDP
jgi:hypothetical protein